MRRTRWLFLAAILGIVFSVGATYYKYKALEERNSPTPPKAIDSRLDAQSQDWTYTKSSGTQQQFFVRAHTMRKRNDSSTIELEDVELHLFHKDGSQYDLVRCAAANFDENAKTLFSDGEVAITMGVPVDGPAHGRVVKIRSSGISFGSDSGKATTDRKASFEFGSNGSTEGTGTAIGAEYDPQTRELHLKSQVSLDWRGKTAQSVPMHIEAGEAFYKERESKVWLMQWSKLKRDTLQMDGGISVVTLEEGEVRESQTENAKGVRDDPGRKVEFAADHLYLHFLDGMVVDRMSGDQNGKLVSTAQTMKTTVTSKHLEMEFDTSTKDSALKKVVATGSTVAEAVPIPRPGAEMADTRVLRSDTLTLVMKNAGKEIDNVETAGPGTIDFLPNRPGQPKRFLKGDKIWIAYGADNRIQSFKSVNVSTRTDKPALPDKPKPDPSFTESKDLVATFDPKTSDLSRLEQKTDFRYSEGDRKARADRATLEQQKDLMTLEGSARVNDPTGSASADKIVMNQKSGDFVADGHVASTREPDKKGKSSSSVLSNDEVMQARAQHMTSAENNTKIHYEGNAVAWQGANRVEADRLDINREDQIMEAHGHVKSQFVDKDKSADDKAASKVKAPPIFTIVTAPDMVYKEEERVVDYTGGVVMKRPDMTITSTTIRAFLKDADSDSSLDKAYADGTVKIVSTSEKLKRTRTGTSEHAEYYAGEEKVVMNGGNPLLIDSVKGQTRGQQLTWFSNDDRLVVDGASNDPVKSTIRKKKK
ncbi:MAG: LPS export ABC transporter periplasmic protein LptC [Acidobacteriia bacterium]|nr:LPS export ABC transporter periplasmic protein LptC [Terriglobia bacterium]